jgi:hypothetical protein
MERTRARHSAAVRLIITSGTRELRKSISPFCTDISRHSPLTHRLGLRQPPVPALRPRVLESAIVHQPNTRKDRKSPR